MNNKTETVPADGPTVYMMFAKLVSRDLLAPAEPTAMFVELTEDEIFAKEINGEIATSRLLSFPIKMCKRLSSCKPGVVYKMIKTPNGVSYTPKSMPAFVIHTPQVTRWWSEHRATERAWSAHQRLARDVKTAPDRKVLDPFRSAYARLQGASRAQLLADVVAYIVTPRSS